MNLKQLRESVPTISEDGPIYLDNACVTLRPQPVIDAINHYYTREPSCGGRSAHKWGMAVTRTEFSARDGIAKLIGADGPSNVVFSRNTTQAINQVAHGINWSKGDIVVISDKEHNSNSIPWRMQEDVEVRVTKTGEDGRFDLEDFERVCSEAGSNLRMVALSHSRNLDGTSIPAKECGEIAKDHDALYLLDAAQSVPHRPVDIREIGADFVAFSIHKMMGPSGMGALIGSPDGFDQLKSISAGGQTVSYSSLDGFTFKPGAPHLEGGLGHYAGYYGTNSAVQILNELSMEQVHEREVAINTIISNGVKNLDGMSIIGPESAEERGGITSILMEGRDPHQFSMLLDEAFGIYARSGLHCVDPWFHENQTPRGSLRFSSYGYNTIDEAKLAVEAISELVEAIPRT